MFLAAPNKSEVILRIETNNSQLSEDRDSMLVTMDLLPLVNTVNRCLTHLHLRGRETQTFLPEERAAVWDLRKLVLW